jgi:Cdc6-like AAA superfamily ATPase
MSVIIPYGSQLSNEVSFPIDLLPKWLQKLIYEHSESYATPQELWATAFLSGISAAAGKKFEIFTGNYSNYPQLWIMVVGSSGTGKSDAFKVAFDRLSEINEKRYVTYKSEREEWKN